MTLTPEQVAARKRLLDDFEFYARHCVKIRTKEGTIVPLVLNRVQKRFAGRITDQMLTNGRVRMVVVKARQQGLSTVISAWQYWWLSQRKAQKGLVMAHEADSTTTLFDMYRRIHDNVPDAVKPSTKYSSRAELVFDRLDSGLRVATAGGRGVARGETLQTAHLSEVAFWPPTFAKANFNGLIQAIPDTDNTAVFLESTGNGMTGVFYGMAKGAQRGANGYELFFSGWHESDEYRDDNVPAQFMHTPDEEQLINDYGLDDAQLWWRRRKIATNGLDMFKQEYPMTPEEAFISTGRPVFNPDTLNERLKKTIEPIKRMAIEESYDSKTGKPLPLRVLREHPRGELLVYHERDQRETYVIGADVGMGLRGGILGRSEGDPSVAQVLDSQLRQVAMWRGRVHPDVFAEILIALAYHYNEALLVPERNNHGLVTCVALRDKEYPNLYLDVAEGTIEPDNQTIQLGVFTSEKTKPLLIDTLRALDRDKLIEIQDQTTLEEMLSYVVTESGKMQAEEGSHDDCVMALALAAYASGGIWKPCAVPEELYVTAI
jgi:hypothetical protein